MSTQLLDAGLTPEQLLDKLDEFMERIIQFSSLIGIDFNAMQLDHIALRVNEHHLAELAHQAWKKYGTVISDTVINGRPIIVLEFELPIKYQHWQIECLELPYPAEGKSYPQAGWEHVEFVVSPSSCVASDFEQPDYYLAALKRTIPTFEQQWPRLESLGISYKLSMPKGENERLNNPTIAFKYQGMAIKVHPYSLKRLVAVNQLV